MDCPGSHVTKRYLPAPAFSDEVFADYSGFALLPHKADTFGLLELLQLTPRP
jgi:hypothetical protein